MQHFLISKKWQTKKHRIPNDIDVLVLQGQPSFKLSHIEISYTKSKKCIKWKMNLIKINLNRKYH